MGVPDDAGAIPAGGCDEVAGGVPGDSGHFAGVVGEGGDFLCGVGVPDDAGAIPAGGCDEVTVGLPCDSGHCAGVAGVETRFYAGGNAANWGVPRRSWVGSIVPVGVSGCAVMKSGLIEGGLGEVGAGQIGVGEGGSAQRGIGEIRFGQIEGIIGGAEEVPVVQVGAR